jgi:YD repeat-containing protein
VLLSGALPPGRVDRTVLLGPRKRSLNFLPATDPGGRVTGVARGGRSLGLAYDAADRVRAVTDLGAGTTTAYVYDGAGRRVARYGGRTAGQGLDV